MKNKKDKGRSKASRVCLFVFRLLEGKTRHAPLLFPPLSAAGTDCLCKEKSRNLKTYFKALRQRGHHATPFRLRCAPCGTVVPLKVTLAKTRFCFALLHFFGCSVTLPGQALLRVRGRAMHLRADLDGGKHNLVLAEKRCGEVT